MLLLIAAMLEVNDDGRGKSSIRVTIVFVVLDDVVKDTVVVEAVEFEEDVTVAEG